MEEIDLKDLYEYFISKIGLFVVIAVSVCLIGCFYGLFIQKPKYSSYTTVLLAGETSITQNDITMNKNLTDTYAEIVKSRKVLDKVIKELKLDMDYSSLAKMIDVTAIKNTTLIKIVVNDYDAKKAMNVANITAKYFVDEISDLYKINNVSVLDEAVEAQEPYNINVLKQTIIYMAIGIVLATGVLFVIFYVDRSIKSVEQIEQKLKMPILGSVQQLSKGGNKRWKMN